MVGKSYYSATKKYSSDRLEDLIEKYNQLGAGEVLLNSVERDGTFRGPDLELIERYIDKPNSSHSSRRYCLHARYCKCLEIRS